MGMGPVSGVGDLPRYRTNSPDPLGAPSEPRERVPCLLTPHSPPHRPGSSFENTWDSSCRSYRRAPTRFSGARISFIPHATDSQHQDPPTTMSATESARTHGPLSPAAGDRHSLLHRPVPHHAGRVRRLTFRDGREEREAAVEGPWVLDVGADRGHGLRESRDVGNRSEPCHRTGPKGLWGRWWARHVRRLGLVP